MKILPVVRASVVFVREDGSIETPAFQVFREGSGTTIRIGRNVFTFDAEGRMTGTESKGGPDLDTAAAVRAYAETPPNGTRPKEAYYPEGTPPWINETRGWPVEPGTRH